MASLSSWNYLNHETSASTPQSTHSTVEEPISQNEKLQVIRQSQEAFLAPTQPLPLLTVDSVADFNEHLNAIHAKEVNEPDNLRTAQILSEELLAESPTQDRTQALSHRMEDETSHLAQSLQLPPASSPVIAFTSVSPVSNPREAISAEDLHHTIPAPLNSVAKSVATHSSTGAPFVPPNSPISRGVGSGVARTWTHHAPKQRKRDLHRIRFLKCMRKRFRKQGPWTPASFHERTAVEIAIKGAEDQGF